ncbi:siderophore iron transporter [Zalerion maritima]|uniref:Siderophore iron transporter n=1 Tax=Zalerion maritima TaxID=339359 RepID=A0AAD5RKP9_9PEZI|nr:siderophore iron transporter [Zalerion maritima]
MPPSDDDKNIAFAPVGNNRTPGHSDLKSNVIENGNEPPVGHAAQAGVQAIEAVTSVRTTASLIVAYVVIWFIYFVFFTQQGALGALNHWVTSAFQQHSLTPTVSIMSGVIGGAIGVVLIAALAFWERFFAPVTIIPCSLLLDRTVVGACALGTTLRRRPIISITEAKHVSQFYTLGSTLFGIVVGVFVRYGGQFSSPLPFTLARLCTFWEWAPWSTFATPIPI